MSENHYKWPENVPRSTRLQRMFFNDYLVIDPRIEKAIGIKRKVRTWPKVIVGLGMLSAIILGYDNLDKIGKKNETDITVVSTDLGNYKNAVGSWQKGVDTWKNETDVWRDDVYKKLTQNSNDTKEVRDCILDIKQRISKIEGKGDAKEILTFEDAVNSVDCQKAKEYFNAYSDKHAFNGKCYWEKDDGMDLGETIFCKIAGYKPNSEQKVKFRAIMLQIYPGSESEKGWIDCEKAGSFNYLTK